MSHTSVEQFSAWLKTVTINSVYIRSIKKRELVNVYREDIQSILPKQRPFPFLRNVIPPRSWVANQGPVRKFCLYFFKSRENKKFEVYSNVLLTAEKRLSENLFCKKARPLRFIYDLSIETPTLPTPGLCGAMWGIFYGIWSHG